MIWDLIILKLEVWRFENFKISRTQLIWVFFCSPRAVCRCLHFYRTFLVQSQSIYLINYDSFVLGCIFARSSTTALYELDLTSTLLAGSALKLLSPTEVFHLPYPHSSNTRRPIYRRLQQRASATRANPRGTRLCRDLPSGLRSLWPSGPMLSILAGHVGYIQRQHQPTASTNVGSRSQRVVLSNVLTQCLHAIPARAVVLPRRSRSTVPTDLALFNCRRSVLQLPSQSGKRRSQAVCYDDRRSATARSATALRTS